MFYHSFDVSNFYFDRNIKQRKILVFNKKKKNYQKYINNLKQ